MEQLTASNIRTERRKEHFLELLESLYISGNVSKAIKVSRHKRTTVYRWRKEDEAFAKKWDQICEYADEALADYAEFRLRELVLRGNSTAIIFCLTRLKPEKYQQ